MWRRVRHSHHTGDGDDSAPTAGAAWRAHLLRRAGLAPEIARAIGHDGRYDLHELLRLLEHGCPPSLAIEIARPLEDRTTP